MKINLSFSNKSNFLKFVSISLILIFSCTELTLSQGTTPRGFPYTPKALDLEDHFGTEPVQNRYGPAAHILVPSDIAREYDSVDGVKLTTPITNLNVINPNEVVHGDLTNTAYDATKIINPLLSNAKAKIETTFVHDAVVSTPVQVATHTDTKDVNIMNRITGEVTTKRVITEKPVISIIKNLRKVSDNKTTYYDMAKQALIDTNPKARLVGV
jgi:hypothetical protein